MNHGHIEQIGSPEIIYNRPESIFVADFVGAANLIRGQVRRDGSSVFETVGGLLLKVDRSGSGTETTVALRSAYVTLQREAGAGANTARGTIHRRMFHGDFIQYVVDWPAGQLIVRRPPTEMIEEGAEVTIAFAPEHCILL
jgi:ABC-type Fe3+/spermidine/putrescine transport system ATPase subunit